MFYITHSNGSNTVAYLRARKIKLITKITDNKQSIGKRRRFCLCAVHVKIWTVGVWQQLFLSQYTPCRNFVESVEFSAISISGGALVGWHFESTERRKGRAENRRTARETREYTRQREHRTRPICFRWVMSRFAYRNCPWRRKRICPQADKVGGMTLGHDWTRHRY